MTKTALVSWLAAPLAALLGVSGCAQIETRSSVEIMPRSDADVLRLGGSGGEIAERGVTVQWTQDGDRLALDLVEDRSCVSVTHVPVVRVERTTRRTTRGAMWWEYGLGAAALGVGLAGLISPESFSQAAIDSNGNRVEETGTGYRIGGIFTAIGSILLTAGVVDTIRTRDDISYADAFRREEGGAVACREPQVPLQEQTVELLVGEWSTTEPTGDDGAVRFLLPEIEELSSEAQAAIAAHAAWAEAKTAADEAAEAARLKAEAEAAAEAEQSKKGRRGRKVKKAEPEPPAEPVATADPGPRPEPFVVKGVLRIDSGRALAIDFLVPYDWSGAEPHQGKGSVDPMPARRPPPRPRSGDAQP
ncbi:MAG: hypothetical protein AAF799_25115 [Myxococcota bacterium]